MSKNPATMQRFIEIGSGVSCLCVISHHSRQSDSAIFWVLEKGHDRNTLPILMQNMSKDAVLRKEVPFRGFQKQLQDAAAL